MTLHAEPDARRCYCGRIGCVNAYLSTSILAETAEGDLQHFFDELPNNRDYHAVWEEYLENLSLAIHNLNMCFNRRVIIGGYLGQYIDPYLEDVRKLCNATGLSIDMIAKKYGQNQNNVLALYMEVMKKIQDGLKNKEERS